MTREQILELLDRPTVQTEDVVVPEWGGVTVQVRSRSAVDEDDWEHFKYLRRQEGKAKGLDVVRIENFSASYLTFCLYHETAPGVWGRMFTIEDAPRLGRQHGAIVHRLFNIAARLNHVDEESVEKKQAAPGGGSGAG